MTRIVQTLLRALTALLFSLAIAAPAAAEIGCSFDEATHLGAAQLDHCAEDDHEPEESQQLPESGGHCAFGHCHGMVAPFAPVGIALTDSNLPFAGAPPPAPASTRSLAPDRPPQG